MRAASFVTHQRSVCILVGVVVLGGAALGKVVYVDDDAPMGGDGSSWQKAYKFLQDGLASAQAGDEVRVAQGVYKPDRSAATPEGNRARGAMFPLANRMTLRGGYAGLAGSDPNAWNATRYQTVLSGDLAGNDTDVNDPSHMLEDPSRADNSRMILGISESTGPVTLDSLWVTGATEVALDIGDANTFIQNCVFFHNCTGDEHAVVRGNRGALRLEDCVFLENYLPLHGKAIWSSGTLTMYRCRFERNPGYYCHLTASRGIRAFDCVLARSTFEGLGFALVWAAAWPTPGESRIENCRFYGNSHAYPALVDLVGPATLIQCLFSGNQSEGPSTVYCEQGALKVLNCTFSDNHGPDGEACPAASADRGQVALVNCIVWDSNHPSAAPLGSNAQMSYSAAGIPWPGEGNIQITDPMFVDAHGPDKIAGTEDDDLRLLPGSPCINQGSNAAIDHLTTTDLAGHPRVIGIVDMGAYEGGRIWYADALSGSDASEGSSPARAFKTIQRAVSSAAAGDMVLVYPGLYGGQIDIQANKWLFIRGVPGPQGTAVIEAPDATAFHLAGTQTTGPSLENLVIRNSSIGVSVSYGLATLKNLTMVGNDRGIVADANSQPQISNCIQWANRTSDLTGCQATYSCIQRQAETSGTGNISQDPLFADPDTGDYHLKSQGGRFSPVFGAYVRDPITSPCIDAGDPRDLVGLEPWPNGHRINMGAYGGTLYASLSRQLPPVVSITSPAAGDWVGYVGYAQQIVVVAYGQDGTVVAVQCLVDGNPVGQAAMAGAVWTYSWTPLVAGTHTLSAVAVDNHGNTGTSDLVVLKVTFSSGTPHGR